MKKIIIGITGGFSTGKSTVTELLEEKGAFRIDADEIAHDILANNVKVKNELLAIFGEEILDGQNIDRRKLGHVVFNDRKKLESLDEIIHPVIFRVIDNMVLMADKEVVVVDAPLLIESGLYKNVDYIVVVTADEHLQLERGAKRGFDSAIVEKIISNQFSINEKIKSADFVLKNNNGLDKLKEGVDQLWQILEGEKKKN